MQLYSRRAMLAGFSALALPLPVIAADQPLKIVFPFAPGGSGDSIARLFAEQLHARLGKVAIVENLAGAGGRIGAQAVKNAAPGEEAVLFASASQFTLQPHLFRSLGYNAERDFVPLTQVMTVDLALAVSGKLPIHSAHELIDWMKANPAQAVYGSPGAGTAPHFICGEFGRITGLNLRHTAYKGTPAALPDVLAGRVPMYMAFVSELPEQTSVPLNSLEGFIRQIIGWREFVRGIYWQHMPGYAESNALGAELPMPAFYWTGEIEMRCLSEAIGHTIQHAYAHHIERLMVLGLFVMLLGVRPYDVHIWHMAMFWDAIDWVSLPNTLGMSQYGDGGIVGTKPYAASGNYIDRMSDHCRHCRYDPKKAVGEDACPFTTLYWNFLDRHRRRLAMSGRMRNQYINLARKTPGELRAIRKQAETLTAAQI